VITMQAVQRCVEECPTAHASLRGFCNARRLSLRSRVELLEQLSDVVGNAYRRGFAFREFTADTVEVDYAHGQLALRVGDEVTLLPRADRDWVRGIATADVLVAANVIHLGRVIAAITGHEDAFLLEVAREAMSLDHRVRPSSAVAVQARLREWLERSNGFAMRWSWA
jgi:hypothetical protein